MIGLFLLILFPLTAVIGLFSLPERDSPDHPRLGIRRGAGIALQPRYRFVNNQQFSFWLFHEFVPLRGDGGVRVGLVAWGRGLLMVLRRP